MPHYPRPPPADIWAFVSMVALRDMDLSRDICGSYTPPPPADVDILTSPPHTWPVLPIFLHVFTIHSTVFCTSFDNH